MADAVHKLEVIPRANSLIVNSGNIISWNRLKRKPIQNPTEEISECLSSTLKTFLSTTNKNQLQYVTNLFCTNHEFKEAVPDTERGDLKLTVKIFLCMLLSPEALKEAIEQDGFEKLPILCLHSDINQNLIASTLKELDVSFIETAILAFPEIENEDLTLETIQPYWKMMQGLVDDGKVLSLGIVDLDAVLLEKLYDWADVKPVVNQVNLNSCCVMPQNLVKYAKQKDIQLLTHNDPREVLPAETLQEAISNILTEKDSASWEPSWILRYSVLVKCRGIVKSKGYLIKATRDVKKKN